jgi:hypothetical protein
VFGALGAVCNYFLAADLQQKEITAGTHNIAFQRIGSFWRRASVKWRHEMPLFLYHTTRTQQNQHALENERNIVQEPIFFPSGVRCCERFPRNKRNTSARVACSMNIYEAFFFSSHAAASALCGLPDFWECSLAGYQLPGCISRSLKCHCRKRSYSGSIGLMLCVRLQQFFCCCRF